MFEILKINYPSNISRLSNAMDFVLRASNGGDGRLKAACRGSGKRDLAHVKPSNSAVV